MDVTDYIGVGDTEGNKTGNVCYVTHLVFNGMLSSGTTGNLVRIAFVLQNKGSAITSFGPSTVLAPNVTSTILKTFFDRTFTIPTTVPYKNISFVVNCERTKITWDASGYSANPMIYAYVYNENLTGTFLAGTLTIKFING